jgi:hypothetical protein
MNADEVVILAEVPGMDTTVGPKNSKTNYLATIKSASDKGKCWDREGKGTVNRQCL